MRYLLLILTLLFVASFAYGLVTIEISNFAFVPNEIWIPIVETVRWINLDSANHTSTSDTTLWDSGIIGPGNNWEFVFNVSPGDYPYHCEINTSMTAMVHVYGTPI